MSSGLRERRRAETVQEIKEAALQRLAEGGAEGLTLRAVARDVGVSVQALYHYFDSRDALITALVVDAYEAVTAAVTRAAGATGSPRERLVTAGLAFRRWAVEHRSAFQLALGAPLPDYAAPEGGPTTAAAAGLGRAFRAVVFDGWSPEELERVPLPEDAPPSSQRRVLPSPGALDLPRGALALFLTGWSTLYGLVMLEALGHLPWTGSTGEQMCRTAMLQYADHLEAVRAGLR